MSHWRTMFDNKYLGSWDLTDKGDVTVEIDRVEAGELENQKGKDKKPLVYFKGASKPLVANKTNCKVISGMYGDDTAKWKGKKITLYATTVDVGGQTTPCIRVRPEVAE